MAYYKITLAIEALDKIDAESVMEYIAKDYNAMAISATLVGSGNDDRWLEDEIKRHFKDKE